MLMRSRTSQAQNSPYFMNTGTPPKKSKLASLSTRGRILLVVGLLLSIGFAIVIFAAIVRNQDQAKLASLARVQATQTELLRISDIGIKGTSPNSSAQVFASTTQQTIQTDQNTLNRAIASSGLKPGRANAKDTTFDAAMSQAKLDNNLAATFSAAMVNKLITYQALIKKAYDNAPTPGVKQALSDSYNHAQILIDSQATSTSEKD